jgi:hypothetical protein
MAKSVCPLCGNTTYTVSKPKSIMSFQFYGNRTCQVCGTMWIPSCPRWGAIVVIVAGAIPFLFGVLWFVALLYALITDGLGNLPVGGVVSLFMIAITIGSGSAIIYGIRVLAGKVGKLQIIVQGKLPDKKQESNMV